MNESQKHGSRRLPIDQPQAASPLNQLTAQHLAAVLDHLDDPIWLADVVEQQVVYRYYSQTVEDLTHYPPTFFLGQPNAWPQLIHPDDQPLIQHRLAQPLRGERVILEYRMYRANGEICWVREKINPLRDGTGQVSTLIGVLVDISPFKSMEAHLKSNTQELMLLNSIIASAASAEDELQILDLVCQKLTYGYDLARVSAAKLNEAKARFTIEIESRSEQISSILQQTVMIQDCPILSQLLSYPAPLTASVRAPNPGLGQLHKLFNDPAVQAILLVPLIIKDQVPWVLIIETAAPAFSASQITYFWNLADQVALILEKTQLIAAAKQAYQQLQQTQARMVQSEKMSALGQLAAGIAHDFNNILTSILGFAELTTYQADVPDLAKRHQQQIIEQGRRGAYLIRQILDFSRQSAPKKQALDLAQFLREVVRLLEHMIPENIELSLQLEPGTYPISADTVQLQQILTNLAVNAKDAMPLGGRLQFRLFPVSTLPLSGVVQPVGTAGWLALAVSDSGAGIPSMVIDHIFEPFFTTKPPGEGTGLGLAQVYGLVRQHDGYIEVASEIGLGTTFTLYFPSQAVPSVPTPSPEPPTLPAGHGEIILLVEDETTVLQVMQQILTHLGYQVLTATNGHEALARYDQAQEPIQLVLTDLTMPQMGGLELAHALSQRDRTLPIVILTGYPLNLEKQTDVCPSVIEWAKKPLRRAQLAQLVSRSLRP